MPDIVEEYAEKYAKEHAQEYAHERAKEIIMELIRTGDVSVERICKAFKISDEELKDEDVDDPFYAETNIRHLENIKKNIDDGKAHYTERDLLDV